MKNKIFYTVALLLSFAFLSNAYADKVYSVKKELEYFDAQGKSFGIVTSNDFKYVLTNSIDPFLDGRRLQLNFYEGSQLKECPIYSQNIHFAENLGEPVSENKTRVVGSPALLTCSDENYVVHAQPIQHKSSGSISGYSFKFSFFKKTDEKEQLLGYSVSEEIKISTSRTLN